MALLALATAAVLVLAGCGSDDNADGDPATAGASAPANEAETPSEHAAAAEARIVDHMLGSTEIPSDPQRIVSLGTALEFEVATLLGLEDRIVGVQGFVLSNDYLDFAEDIVDVTPGGEINIEQIAALDPDLIVGHHLALEDIYDELSQIAPTVVMEFETSAEFKEMGRMYAEWLGGEEGLERHEAAVEEYLTRARDLGDRAEEVGDPELGIIRASSEFQRWELADGYSGTILYQDAGLAVPPGIRELTKPATAASPMNSSSSPIGVPVGLSGSRCRCAPSIASDHRAALAEPSLGPVDGGAERSSYSDRWPHLQWRSDSSQLGAGRLRTSRAR